VIRGSRAWLVRALRDWALDVRQGMALVTYRSWMARDLAIDDLTQDFGAHGRKTETLKCADGSADDFIANVAGSNADVLFVVDVDRLLFGENNDRSPFWVNFHRETLVAHKGVQVWWLTPNAATRFGQQLPDLSRFFLFREELTDEVEADRGASIEIQVPQEKVAPVDADRGRHLLQRALKAAKNPKVNAGRFWLELGLPVIDAYFRSGQMEEGRDVLEQLECSVGPPQKALSDAVENNAPEKTAATFLALSRLYRSFGRPEDALAMAEEAVRIYRRESRPGSDDSATDLSISLNNLAVMLSDAGRREEALSHTEEAVRIRRQLAERNPEAFLLGLAGALNNLANRLDELGRREEALAQTEEAVRIRRGMAERHPESLPDLAGSLSNLSNRLTELGRSDEALAQAEEAVRIRRQLADQRPDAFLPGLAGALNNLANRLSELGRREEALTYAGEAVRIYRQMAEQRPEAFLPDLAGFLNNLANRLRELDHREEALAQAGEALRIYRGLAEQRPALFLPNVAASLSYLANRLSELGRREEALVYAEEAVSIYRRLAQERPDAFAPSLARSMEARGRIAGEHDPEIAP